MKIIKILFFTILFTLFAKEISIFIFQSKVESRVYNTGFFYLSQNPLSSLHNFDSLFSPYHIYLLNFKPSPIELVRYFENICYLSYAIIFFSFSLSYGLLVSFILSSIVVISPLTLIQRTWISFPDTFTFLFSLIFVIQKLYSSKDLMTESTIVSESNKNFINTIFLLKQEFKKKLPSYFFFIIIISFGLFNHFYQFFIISLEIISISFFFLKNKYRFILDLIFLILVAFFIRCLTQYLFLINNIDIVDYRLNFVKSLSYSELIKINFTNLFTAIYGFLFGLWIIFLYDVVFKRNYTHIFIFFNSFCITCFTIDTTRVFTLLFFVPFLYSLILNLNNYTNREKKILSYLVVLSSLIFSFQPLYYKWGEKIIYLK